jgi:amidase
VKYLDAWSYCEWFNVLGFPAVVVPMGLSDEGLPIGIQIAVRPWEEELVLAVAAALEKERGDMPTAEGKTLEEKTVAGGRFKPSFGLSGERN